MSASVGCHPCVFQVFKATQLKSRLTLDAHEIDIDGDGRLDYCVVAGNGDIYCWRNGGQGDMAEYWQDFGAGSPVFTGKGMGSIDGVRLGKLWYFPNDNRPFSLQSISASSSATLPQLPDTLLTFSLFTLLKSTSMESKPPRIPD